jgi:TorA maturation chaperone TorD
MAHDAPNLSLSPSTVSQLAPQRPRPIPVGAEDAARAALYGLLATLLRVVPTERTLGTLRGLDPTGGRDAFALAWEGVGLAAGQMSQSEADDEYHRLFIGLGRGELIPYGSWYQTGFLMELPLGELRRDLAALGFEREPGVCEPEDHVAALCEVMAQLAADPELPADLAIERQRAFYRAHLAPWIARFCADLEDAPGAPLYASVGRLAGAFFELEGHYLELEE